MVSITAIVDGVASAAFQQAMTEYAASLGKTAKTAPQRAAIQVCKSFRAATKTAPKRARPSEYKATRSETRPKHITAKNGLDLRRYTIDRPIRGKKYDVFVYSHLRHRKGKIVPDRGAEMREVRAKLVLFHRGLAKQSWGWVMHNIFNGAAPDTAWRKRKNDQRNPKDATRDSYSRQTPLGGIARICNRLDYVQSALRGFSVTDAMTKAAHWMVKQVELRRR